MFTGEVSCNKAPPRRFGTGARRATACAAVLVLSLIAFLVVTVKNTIDIATKNYAAATTCFI